MRPTTDIPAPEPPDDALDEEEAPPPPWWAGVARQFVTAARVAGVHTTDPDLALDSQEMTVNSIFLDVGEHEVTLYPDSQEGRWLICIYENGRFETVEVGRPGDSPEEVIAATIARARAIPDGPLE